LNFRFGRVAANSSTVAWARDYNKVHRAKLDFSDAHRHQWIALIGDSPLLDDQAFEKAKP
jgi:hypothetical protein